MKGIKRTIAVILSILLAVAVNPSRDIKAAAAEDMVYIGIKGEINYDYAFEVLNLLNELRQSVGVEPLTMDYTLMNDAMFRAAEASIFFSHTRPNGEVCYTAFTDEFWNAGENIAAGQLNPTHVMNSWTNSQGHYENMIEESFTSVGIGCFEASNGCLCWVQLFNSNEAKEKAVSGTKEASYTIEAKKENLDVKVYFEESPCSLMKGETFKPRFINSNVGFTYVQQEIEVSSLSFTSSDREVVAFSDNGTATVMGIGISDLTVVTENGGAELWAGQFDSGHLFTDCCSTSCEYCSLTRTAPHSCGQTPCDQDKICSLCGVMVEVGTAHKYSGAGDAFCNICGVERELKYVPGDADGDQTVTTADLATLKLYLAGSMELEEVSKTLSDFNKDSSVDTTDLATLKLHLAGVVAI